jgi:tetratricopeptide (TPR) repeat protein
MITYLFTAIINIRPKHLFTLLCVFLSGFATVQAQENRQIDSIYKTALAHYQQKETGNAILQFEKIIVLNPRHKDALYNLAVINYELGNKDKAINLFQSCVKLKDRGAAKILKEQPGQTIAYADTMFFEDLDVKPKVLVISAEEDLLINNNLNKAVIKQIQQGFGKSKILKKELGAGIRIMLSLYFGKDGSLDAEVLRPAKNEIVQAEITSILKNIKIIPGRYLDQTVVTWGFTLPMLL